MYKVFINNKPLILASGKLSDYYHDSKNKIISVTGNNSIKESIEILLSGTELKEILLVAENEIKLWETFCSNFKLVEAAGGLVFNKKKELLMIYRFDKWDLPKGKIKEDEKEIEAALREVCEETGVCDLEVTKSLPSSYHTYFLDNKKHVLKKTFWFEMSCKNFFEFKLQSEEGIKEAKWMNKKQLKERMEIMYPSIAELIKIYN